MQNNSTMVVILDEKNCSLYDQSMPEINGMGL